MSQHNRPYSNGNASRSSKYTQLPKTERVRRLAVALAHIVMRQGSVSLSGPRSIAELTNLAFEPTPFEVLAALQKLQDEAGLELWTNDPSGEVVLASPSAARSLFGGG